MSAPKRKRAPWERFREHVAATAREEPFYQFTNRAPLHWAHDVAPGAQIQESTFMGGLSVAVAFFAAGDVQAWAFAEFAEGDTSTYLFDKEADRDRAVILWRAGA